MSACSAHEAKTAVDKHEGILASKYDNVARAFSEILPDGDKEKHLIQGLLSRRDGLMAAARQGALFKGNA